MPFNLHVTTAKSDLCFEDLPDLLRPQAEHHLAALASDTRPDGLVMLGDLVVGNWDRVRSMRIEDL